MIAEFINRIIVEPLNWKPIYQNIYPDFESRCLIAIINDKMQSGYFIMPNREGTQWGAFFIIGKESQRSFFLIEWYDSEAIAQDNVNQYHELCIRSAIRGIRDEINFLGEGAL